MDSVPVVSLENFLNNSNTDQAAADCKSIYDSFHKTSCLIVKDPRVTFQDNETFLTMMERYYDQPKEKKLKDARPEWSFQVGSTPDFTEVPRNHEKLIEKLDQNHKPHTPKGADAKWRFFWRVGERPKQTQFESLNMPQVLPEDFPEWESVMNKWAQLMMGAVNTVSEMLAMAMGLEKDTFTKMQNYGPHLLAPTGSDLGVHNKIGDILAGFHYDLNFLTIHGKSRFPGLYIWLRDGTKIQVRVPDGCLLLQAGKQLEWLTGGNIEAGFHEVVVCDGTLKAIEKAKEEKRPLWRVSSTLFAHIGSDETLKPLKSEWNTDEAKEKYPPTKTGDQVNDELKKINLQK